MVEVSDNKKIFRKRVYRYVIKLVKFLVKLPKDSVCWELVSQLTASGTSIGANYFESEGAASRKDYINFFTISLKSANESKYWLALIKDAGFVQSNVLDEWAWLFDETKELSNIFASSILTMKKSKAKHF